MSKNGQMQSKLSSLRSQIVTTKGKKGMPPPTIWKGDNVDHINVWEEGQSELGRLLSHRYKMSFNHSHFGRFQSIEGFDAYIQSKEKDDRFRYVSGARLRDLQKQVTREPVTNFRAIFIDTYFQRIKQNAKLLKLFVESTLPFDLYYVIEKSGIPVRPSRGEWFAQGLEELRSALKEGREPDLTFLLLNNQTNIYAAYEKEAAAAPVKEQPKKKPAEHNKQKKGALQVGVAKVDPASIPADLPDDIGNRVDPAVAPAEEVDGNVGERTLADEVLSAAASSDEGTLTVANIDSHDHGNGIVLNNAPAGAILNQGETTAVLNQ